MAFEGNMMSMKKNAKERREGMKWLLAELETFLICGREKGEECLKCPLNGSGKIQRKSSVSNKRADNFE